MKMGGFGRLKFNKIVRTMMNQEIIDEYRKRIRVIERNVNLRICGCCGCNHEVRLHIGDDLQITPIYRGYRPCDDHMRDVMREIRALQKRMGLPENIC